MNKRGMLVLVSGLVWLALAGSAWAQDAGALIKQGDAAWNQRSASEANAQAAIAAFEQAAAADPKNAEAFYKVARGYYYLGRFAPAAKKEALFVKGIEAARKGTEANPSSAGAHYWYAACLAKSLENKGIGAKLKAKGDMETHLKKAQALDPSFYFGGPDRAIGMILYKSPTASNKEAIQHLRKSLSYAPDYSLTLVSLAEVLLAEKQYDEVKTTCDKVLGLKPMAGFERELADDQALAKKLLASIPK